MVKVFYWREKELGAYAASSGFPAILQLVDPRVYALPSIEYSGLFKVSNIYFVQLVGPRVYALPSIEYSGLFKVINISFVQLVDPKVYMPCPQ